MNNKPRLERLLQAVDEIVLKNQELKTFILLAVTEDDQYCPVLQIDSINRETLVDGISQIAEEIDNGSIGFLNEYKQK